MTRPAPAACAAVLLAGLCAIAGAARAEAFISGSQLTRACAGSSPADDNACNGYIAGVLDTVAANGDTKGSVCPPANTKLRVLREAMAKFGQTRPEAAKGSGVDLVTAMIRTNYPCPAK